MKFGVCCGEDRFGPVAEMGYKYVETVFNRFNSMQDSEFKNFISALKAYELKSEACNCFFTSDIHLVGEQANHSILHSYINRGMERATEAGCKIIVLGSGGARNIPEGFERKRAEEQFCNVLQICGDISKQYGIKIAIEPLNAGETNFINTVADGLEICDKLNHPNIGVLADFYHIYKSGESLEAVENAGDRLFHVHLARGNDDRGVPVGAEDLEDCKKWAAALKKCGYDGRISLEAKFKPDFETAIKDVLPALEIFGK